MKIIAEAIHFAHQRGTLHRDLKPQNILIDAADQPRITDFGLAKIAKEDSQLTQSGVIMGSPSYMPPEQAAGRLGEVGPASDVYSLGAVLYELLTGRPPFRGESAMATLREVMEDEPAAPRRLKADVPPDLETICLKCLEKSPAARYHTARGLAEELDRFLKGEPIQARPAGSVRKIVSWVRRHPGLLSAVAALVIVALAYGVFYLFEENSFLRARQADPALARVRGRLHDSLDIWTTVNAMAGAFAVLLNIVVRTQARGVPFRQSLSPGWHIQPLQPLSRPASIVAASAGLFAIGCSVMLLAKTIEAHVWEGEFIRFGLVGMMYFSTYFGILLLGYVVRDYRLVNYGRTSTDFTRITDARLENLMRPVATPEMTAEQIAALQAIRPAMEKWDHRSAVGLYRTAFPSASRREALFTVYSLGATLRKQDPIKFALPPLSPANLSWAGMLVCGLIEAAVVGAVWYANPPVDPLSTGLLLTYNFLFGIAMAAFDRVDGFRRRALLLTPGLLAVIIGETLHQTAAGPWRIGYTLLLVAALLSFSAVKRKMLRKFLLMTLLLLAVIVMVIGETAAAPPEGIWPGLMCFAGIGMGALVMFAGLAGEQGRALQKKFAGGH